MLNPEMGRVFGRPAAELLGRGPEEVLAPEEAAAVRRFDAEVLEGGEPTRREERLEGRDAYAWSMVIRFPVRDAAGRIVRIGGFDLDITAQKRALAKLAASERRLREISESHPVPMSITRLADRRLLYANRAFLTAFRLAPEDLDGFDRDRLYTDPRERHAIFERLARDGLVEGHGIRLRQSDGTPFPAALTARLIGYEGAPCSVASFLDLTALKVAEAEVQRHREALHQSEKLTALGSLLAGVAHELNNPLSVVTGYAEMLRDTATDPATRTRAERVHGAAERCARIVKTFLAMARQKPPQRGPVDLPAVVSSALELTAYGLRTAGVTVTVGATPGLPLVWGDADQLHQVLVNLVVNAQQALVQSAPPRRLAIRAEARDGTVVVEVEDNGPGMPPDVRKRALEPFFTTKPQGVGTGIGLSVCHGIVAAHGGRIEVESEPGRGTLFRVTLPVAAGGTAVLEGTVPGPVAAAAGRGLVGDDEREIAELGAETLEQDGYEVEAVTGGRAALARLARGGIDLLVSDLRMPDVDGTALIEALREREGRAVPLILVTGDALGAGMNEVVRAAGMPVLEKPLDLAALRREVRRMLRDGEEGA